MNATVRVAFALLLSSLPGRQILAQAAPSDGPLRADVPPLVREAPPVEPGASAPTAPALLLSQPIVENRKAALEEPTVKAVRERAWSDWSTEKKVLVVGGGVLALVILGIVSIG